MAGDGIDGKGVNCDAEQHSPLASETYFLAYPEHGVMNLFKYFWSLLWDGCLAGTSSSGNVKSTMNGTTSWQQSLAMVLVRTLSAFSGPLAAFGRTVELIGNIFVANGGLLKTLYRLFLSAWFLFKKGPLIVPSKESEHYKTIIGLVDPRTALFVDHSEGKEHSDETSAFSFPGPDYGSRSTADVLVMAAKLAYENKAVIKNVVTEAWRMNFVGFYNCWNEFQQRSGTQAFIFTDKAEDAQAIVIAWRGTEPFNAFDWSTDFDFSWYKLKGVGNVHTGFLEALGLANRCDPNSFKNMSKKNASRRRNDDLGEQGERTSASGLAQDVIDSKDKLLAYDEITQEVAMLLVANPKAKLFITGHSLGGALSVLYTGLLYHNRERALTDKIAAIYTFGQPRVGNQDFAKYMHDRLIGGRYYRVVYCNDLVPRVPFDDFVFQFKHWGLCFYYNSLFQGETLAEAPNKNFFFLTDVIIMHFNAVWELVNSFFLRFSAGSDFTESYASILYRTMGLLVPGLGAHSPVNYVNAIRLGTPSPMLSRATEQLHSIDRNVHDLEVMIRNNLYNCYLAIRSHVTGRAPTRAHRSKTVTKL